MHANTEHPVAFLTKIRATRPAAKDEAGVVITLLVVERTLKVGGRLRMPQTGRCHLVRGTAASFAVRTI